MNGIKSELGEQMNGLLELLLCFSGKAYDDIGSKSNIGDGKAYSFD